MAKTGPSGQVNMRLPEPIARHLKALAELTRVDQTDIVKVALSDWLEENPLSEEEIDAALGMRPGIELNAPARPGRKKRKISRQEILEISSGKRKLSRRIRRSTDTTTPDTHASGPPKSNDSEPVPLSAA